ncbi:hypothetical protein ZWY2020_041208 [Hordeum vulgare]|nr:hypothetical protein ZWY2020_041208 [Hordeum vulgare]
MGFVEIVVFLCLLHSPYYVSSVKSTNAHGNLSTEIKDATLVRPPNFHLVRRDKFQPGEFKDNLVGRFAIWRTQPRKYYGLGAKIGLWAHPNQEHYRVQSIHIAHRIKNIIESEHPYLCIAKLGSMFNSPGSWVFPYLYNNGDVGFYMGGSRSTGCYNLQCSGFVPAEGASLVTGQAFGPPSTYGEEGHYITISLHKDPNTGNWVLYRDDLRRPSFLGHFPKDLCPELNGVAPQVLFAGFVSYPKNGRGPAIGSGHFPEEGERKAAYFKNMKIFDSNASAHDPIPSNIQPFMNRPDC